MLDLKTEKRVAINYGDTEFLIKEDDSGARSHYKNARNMLPEWLLEKVQEYIHGELVYIPNREASRAGWGEANGTRERYMERNLEILRLYNNGTCIEELAQRYFLSEHSIKKIVSSTKNGFYKNKNGKSGR